MTDKKSKSKAKRPYAQDFSGGSLTDQSFAPSCDVNNIVRHYEKTGSDPYEARKASASFGEAQTLSYEDAMRNAAELASYVETHGSDPTLWPGNEPPPEALETASESPELPPAEPAPQDAQMVGNGD